MAEFQITGDVKKLGKNPVASPSANPSQGQVQITGDQIKLSRTPVTSPSANPGNGQYQIQGDKTNLNRNPVKGWGSAASLPMSDHSISQSATAATKGRKGK